LYTYGYDALNRLTGANFKEWTGSTWNDASSFDVSGLSYDLNGNIETFIILPKI